jgi:ribokinase
LKIHEGVSSRQTEEDFIDSYFNARLVHIGPAPFSSQVRLSRLLRQRDISVSFDPHSQYDEMSSKRAQRMLKNVSLLFCNETEARNISKRPTVMSSANRILRSGPSLLVVTLGGRGAIAYTRERTLRILPAKAHRIVDYVGAGDSFAAGFLTAFLQNKDLEECGRQGATVAAKKLQDYGLRVFLDMGRVLRYG